MSAKRQKKQMGMTELVILESGEGSVSGPSGAPGPSDWLRAKQSPGGQRQVWLAREGPPEVFQGPGRGTGAKEPLAFWPASPESPPREKAAVSPADQTPEFLRSEMAQRLGIRELYEAVRSLDDCFFSTAPDYPAVGVICKRILCAAAEVVVRLYPKELGGLTSITPVMATHVLDSFFASRMGEDLEAPNRKLLRNALVLSLDQLELGTPARWQAAACMESIRFVVSSLLVLL
jgi:hypothetical protein